MLFVFLLLLVSGCGSAPEKSEETLFLENVMIRERGLYVLMGSKPMSTFYIDSGFPETAEEVKPYYDQCLRGESGKRADSADEYADFVQDCLSSKHLHHKYLWHAVGEKIQSSVGPCYLFVARKTPFGQRRINGLFINVPNTLYALKRYYHEFAEIYGQPFDPEAVLTEISREDSLFWSRMFASNYAQGLLFGYGGKNSFAFEWQTKHGVSLERLAVEDQPLEPLTKKDVEVSDLSLPAISTYFLSDDVLEKYRKERALIFKELKGKDFTQTVKKWLNQGHGLPEASHPKSLASKSSASS